MKKNGTADYYASLGPCVEWTRGRMKTGYGELRMNGTMVYAHRVAYCEHHKIPLESIKGKLVRHRCDNKGCINPEHLILGTHAENYQDAAERGNPGGPQRGEKNFNAKLTDDKIREIRSSYIRGDRQFGSTGLGRKYGVDGKTIHSIVAGKAWVHVDGEQT